MASHHVQCNIGSGSVEWLHVRFTLQCEHDWDVCVLYICLDQSQHAAQLLYMSHLSSIPSDYSRLPACGSTTAFSPFCHQNSTDPGGVDNSPVSNRTCLTITPNHEVNAGITHNSCAKHLPRSWTRSQLACCELGLRVSCLGMVG